jgi:hypothetical protein
MQACCRNQTLLQADPMGRSQVPAHGAGCTAQGEKPLIFSRISCAVSRGPFRNLPVGRQPATSPQIEKKFLSKTLKVTKGLFHTLFRGFSGKGFSREEELLKKLYVSFA